MLVEINSNDINTLNFGAAGSERIIQNIINLLNTFKYEISYDRTLGLTGDFIDKPDAEAIIIATNEITEAIMDYFPYVLLKEVSVTSADEENLEFKVVIEVE